MSYRSLVGSFCSVHSVQTQAVSLHRWPTIITGVIDELARINGTLDVNTEADKLAESKQIISTLAELIYEIRHDRELSLLPKSGLPDDIDEYNAIIEAAEPKLKWFNASWLYAECYLSVESRPHALTYTLSVSLFVSYRRVRGVFAHTTHWSGFDCFATQKLEAFRSSAKGIMTLAQSVQQLVQQGPSTDEQVLHADWIKMLEVCLWGEQGCYTGLFKQLKILLHKPGNATDLSLLTSLTHEDIQALQSVERGKEFVLKNDFAKSWAHIRTLKDARLDIVLDNVSVVSQTLLKEC